MTKVENATLKAIAAKFAHMPDEDITVLEKQVADILVDAGYLQIESLEYNPGQFIDEYVLTTSARS
jgi:hypothetical protein